MSDTTIIILVNAVLLILGLFGIWKKVQVNIAAVKEWIDVGTSGFTLLTNSLQSLADGKLEKEELEKFKQDAANFKKELEEAKNLKLIMKK